MSVLSMESFLVCEYFDITVQYTFDLTQAENYMFVKVCSFCRYCVYVWCVFGISMEYVFVPVSAAEPLQLQLRAVQLGQTNQDSCKRSLWSKEQVRK